MKIALVSPYDFAYPGGVAHHISYLRHYFTKWGHEVRIIAPMSGTAPNPDGFIAIGKPIPVPFSGSIARIALSPWLSPRVKAVLNEEKFDIIHLHEPLIPMLCTTVLRLSQTVNIGTFHAASTRPSYRWGKPFIKWLFKRWFRKLDGKIAVSESSVEYIKKHFPGHLDIIPNGVDLEHFSPDVSPIDEFCDGKLNILFVGRLEKRKGVSYLLKAYKQVKQAVPDSRLIIVGPGTRLRNKYEKHVMESGLRDVVFAGYVGYKELPRYYKTADIFCAPAIGQESFGIILLEAMAMGKPIVASNIAGYAGVVTPGVDGLLVPPKDEKMLAQALISLMTDESRRQQMGANGRLKAMEHGWERIARRILDYYTKVLGESSHRQRGSRKVKISRFRFK